MQFLMHLVAKFFGVGLIVVTLLPLRIALEREHMKMFEFQPGLGFGYTNFRLVFVFVTVSAMEGFVG